MLIDKKLTLLRHGEADLGIGQEGDLKRRLSKQGNAQILRLSNLLESEKINFDYALISPASRCLETFQIINKDERIKMKEKHLSIYEASVVELLNVIESIDNAYSEVLLVGHNPGISHLAGFLTGDSSVLFVPGMLVRISFQASSWKMISRNSGSIMEVMQ